MLVAWLGLEVLNVILDIVMVILMLATAASSEIINPDLVKSASEVGIDAEDVPTVIWTTAVVASAIYITATGKHYGVTKWTKSVLSDCTPCVIRSIREVKFKEMAKKFVLGCVKSPLRPEAGSCYIGQTFLTISVYFLEVTLAIFSC